MGRKKKFSIKVKGLSEEQVLAIIEDVSVGLSHKYTFGYYDLEDIQQEARLIALDKLSKYNPDGGGSLKTFLWQCVKNALSNLKRDKFERLTKPCKVCSRKGSDQCNPKHCRQYNKWKQLNDAKKNLSSPITIDSVSDENEPRMSNNSSIVENIAGSEIINLLDRYIPIEFRQDYLRLKSGATVSKHRKIKIKEIIEDILTEHNYNIEEFTGGVERGIKDGS